MFLIEGRPGISLFVNMSIGLVLERQIQLSHLLAYIEKDDQQKPTSITLNEGGRRTQASSDFLTLLEDWHGSLYGEYPPQWPNLRSASEYFARLGIEVKYDQDFEAFFANLLLRWIAEQKGFKPLDDQISE